MIRALAGLAAALAVGTGAAAAHEFWIEPQRFWTPAGSTVAATFMVGIGPDRSRWAVGPARVARLDVHSRSGVRDARSGLREPGGAVDTVFGFPRVGLQVVALESRPSLSVLPAERFHAYLAEEGLQAAIAYRTTRGEADRPGRETYSRRAKALIQVGPVDPRDDALATSPIGQALEIVPEANPYRLPPGRPLPVQVLFQGRPLGGARVKLFSLDLGQRSLAQATTDASGRASFVVPARGDWLLTVVWTRPVSTPDADFSTIFSSLTFGYPVERRP